MSNMLNKEPESEVRKMARRKKQVKNVLATTLVCILFCNLLGREMILTKLDISYLFMLIYLCVKSIFEESGN